MPLQTVVDCEFIIIIHRRSRNFSLTLLRMSAPCLPVPPKRKRTDSEPESGEDEDTNFDDIETMEASEYLARVVQQAQKLPDVFESTSHDNKHEIPEKHRNHVPIDGSAASLSYLISDKASLTRPPSEDHLPKSKEVWVKATIQNFDRLRDYLADCREQGIGGKMTDRIPFPPMKDRAGWHQFCVGTDEASGNAGSYFGDDYEKRDGKEEENRPQWQQGIPPRGHIPTVRLLCQMDQVLVRRVIGHLGYYSEQGWELSKQRAAWIYALLARLEKPVHRDDAAALFALLKVLTWNRASIDVLSKQEELAQLNVLIVLIGIYFQQGSSIIMSVS